MDSSDAATTATPTAVVETTNSANAATTSSNAGSNGAVVTSPKSGDENTNTNNGNTKAVPATKNSEQQGGSEPAPTTPTKTPEKKKVRRSRRNYYGSDNPIIAPGFGTHKDLEQLSADLGGILPVTAVEAMMQSRGRGIRRSKRGGDDDEDGAAAGGSSGLAGLTSPGTSNAWAAFMSEEGVGVTTKKTDDDDAGGTRSARKRKQDDKAAASSKAAAKSGSAGGDDMEYDLSIFQDELGSAKKSTKKKKSVGSAFGSLVQAGTLDATMIGRKTLPKSSAEAQAIQHLAVPTVLLPKIAITKVFSSCNSAHALALDHASNLYGWGRNEQHQLGSSLPSKVVVTPQIIASNCRTAAVGKSHSLMIDSSDGQIMAIGSNKSGQCGWRAKQTSHGTWKVSTVVGASSPSGINFVKIACGEDFSVALDEDGNLYTTGSSEYGQLGNGETGEYFVSANKLAFANGYGFERRSMVHIEDVNKNDSSYFSSTASQKMKTKPVAGKPMKFQAIACGKHHALAVEAPRISSAADADPSSYLIETRVVTWGCGSYGCLGHGRQADEYFPRVLTTLPVGVHGAKVAGGSQCSLLQTTNGHVYFWGKLRSGSAGGEAMMKPKLVEELAHNNHVVTHSACGASSIACATTTGDVIVWGTGPHGELGLGHEKKSSAKPTFVESLAPPKDPKPLLSLACGQGSFLAVVDEGSDLKLPQLDQAAVEEAMAAVVASGDKEE